MRLLPAFLGAAALAGFALTLPMPAAAQGVFDEWDSVKAPPPPALTKVTLDPKTTALLVLDLARQTCNSDTRPRCIAMLPRAAKLLQAARAKGWFVVYTLGAASKPSDILPEVAMKGGEPVVTSGPDKFVNTDLEKILKDKGITTVVAIGAAAHGAVLYTASGAAFRGFNTVVPVDGMASENAYAEQFTAWQFVHAPRLPERLKLTRLDMIE